MDDRTSTELLRTHSLEAPTALKPVKRRKRRPYGVIVLLLVAVGLGYWLYTRPASQPAGGRRGDNFTMPVVAATAVKGDIDLTLDALGTVTPLATVTVVSQIAGYLMRVAYQEGQMVKKGDLLAEIDSRPYELALAQAQGALERDQATARRPPNSISSAIRTSPRPTPFRASNSTPRPRWWPRIAATSFPIRPRSTPRSSTSLLPHHCAGDRPSRAAACRSRQLRDAGPHHRPRRCITQLQPISVIFTVPEDYPAADHRSRCARMRRSAQLRTTAAAPPKLSRGDTADARQPDRHHHRHAETARPFRQ